MVRGIKDVLGQCGRCRAAFVPPAAENRHFDCEFMPYTWASSSKACQLVDQFANQSRVA